MRKYGVMKVIDHYSPRGCGNGLCPGIIVTDRNTVIIQGRVPPKDDKTQLTVPGYADIVEIPKERTASRPLTAETGCCA
jgi:hypothetical protein